MRQLRKIVLACYLPRSVNELVNELSGISLFTIPCIDLHINLCSQKHDISYLDASKTLSTYLQHWLSNSEKVIFSVMLAF